MKKTIKKPLSKSQERNRRIQFNMHIGQENEVEYRSPKPLSESRQVNIPMSLK